MNVKQIFLQLGFDADYRFREGDFFADTRTSDTTSGGHAIPATSQSPTTILSVRTDAIPLTTLESTSREPGTFTRLERIGHVGKR